MKEIKLDTTLRSCSSLFSEENTHSPNLVHRLGLYLFLVAFGSVCFYSVSVRVAKDLVHEAQMHKLRHPNVVMLIAVTFEQNHYGVVLEFVKYGGLDNFIQTFEVRFAIV